ncbi:MAG: hypothetical protein FWG99_03140 [Treponema sp.]|nr:hypothetical protein [Treponema sp.]
MNKIKNRHVVALSLLAITLFFTANCSRAKKSAENISAAPQPDARGDVIEVRERMFIGQVNDIYLNTANYLGKTIKLEGIFKAEQYQERDEPYYFVVRYGPGCCGNDGNAGFEVAWTGDIKQPYPAPDSWVEAMGVLDTYEEDGYSGYLYLDLSSLTVLNKRGAEFVSQ